MRKYDAVIFDLYGTLVSIFRRQEYIDNMAEMTAVLRIPNDEFYRLWLETGKQRSTGGFKSVEESIAYICRTLSVPVPNDRIKLAAKVRLGYVARVMTPREDALKVLSHLKSAGYKTGLISNCSSEPPELWKNTPFAPLIDVPVFSSVAGMRKPDLPIYSLAVERLGVESEKCLYIGDGDNGELQGARQAGMTPVLIKAPDEHGPDVIRDEGTNNWNGAVVSSLSEVLNLL